MKRIIGVILLACTMCLSSCKNREVKETLPLCRVMTVAAKAVEINESYSASIQVRGSIQNVAWTKCRTKYVKPLVHR